MPAPPPPSREVVTFLTSKFGPISRLEKLGGGFWSVAYAFTVDGRELVLRLGPERSWFDADRLAMRFARPGLPIPDVIEVGEAFGAAFAVSVRHHGLFLESIGPEKASALGPTLVQLLEALFLVPPEPGAPVVWHEPNASATLSWRDWAMAQLVDDPSQRTAGWRDGLAAHPHADRVFAEAERRAAALIRDCPERRDLVHGDLLHANVLVSDDACSVTAVLSWKCSVRGDFLYDTAWCTFWGGYHPGIAAADPWSRVFGSPLINESRDALVDASLRHFSYELVIGASHPGWNVWTNNGPALKETVRLLEQVLDRGPLRTPAPPAAST